MQDDSGPELRAEGGQRLGDDVASFGPVVLPAVGGDVEPGGQETRELLAPEAGDGEVDPDAAEPGARRGGGRVPVAGAIGAGEGLLREVLAGCGAEEHPA